MVARVKDLDPDKGAPWEGFHEKKRIAAEMFATGETVKRIVEALKIDRTTVWRWSIHPDFVEYVRLLSHERYLQNLALANHVFGSSLRTIGAAAEKGDVPTSLGFVRAYMGNQK